MSLDLNRIRTIKKNKRQNLFYFLFLLPFVSFFITEHKQLYAKQTVIVESDENKNDKNTKNENDFVDAQTIECRIPFKVNTTNVNKIKLNDCLKSVKPTEVQAVFVSAAASPDGPTNKNFRLSADRVKSLYKTLKKMFPKAVVKARASGVSQDQMRSGNILVILKYKKFCDSCKPGSSRNLVISLWAGVESIYLTGAVTHYMGTYPVPGALFGASLGFLRFGQEKRYMLYGAVISDLAARKQIIDQDAAGNQNVALYILTNVQLLLGLDYILWDWKVAGSMFVEAGPAWQYRSFIITQNGSAQDYSITTSLGASGNAGLNLLYNTDNNGQIFVRGAVNFMLGQPQNKYITIGSSTEIVNTNPLTWGPSVSLGWRF